MSTCRVAGCGESAHTGNTRGLCDSDMDRWCESQESARWVEILLSGLGQVEAEVAFDDWIRRVGVAGGEVEAAFADWLVRP